MRICVIFFCLILFLCSTNTLYAQSNFVTIPSTSYQIVDGITGINVDVSVSEFIISKTEITQGEFYDIMNYNPSYHKGQEYPVENVSWWEAVRFCNLRSMKEGLQPCYNLSTGECDFSKNGFRLPTDAEWSLADSNNIKFLAEGVHKYANIGSSNTRNIPELIKSLNEKETKEVGSYPLNLL